MRCALTWGRPALRESRLPAGETDAVSPGVPAGLRPFPSHTRLRAGGCYGFQIDGESFGRVIVFKAQAWNLAASLEGAPGCRPPSPVAAYGTRLPESQATAVRGSVGALFFPGSGVRLAQQRAIFTGLVGRELKIVFRLTGSGAPSFSATGPRGVKAARTFGPEEHEGSTWERSGEEWGIDFRFDRPGCLHLHSERRGAASDIWMLVR